METLKPWMGLTGRRIRFVSSSDPYTRLKEGDHGTIIFVDDLHTIHVRWDSGSSLGLIIGEDSFDLIPEGYNTLNDFMEGNRQ